MAYKTIFFDVDGTLCDPGKSMIESARYALSKMGIEETDDNKLHQLIGPPLEHAFKDVYNFSSVEVDEAVKHFRHNLQSEGVQLYEAYPGIADLLEGLQQEGKNIAVVTSKIEHIAIQALDSTGLLRYFKIICAQQPGVVVEKSEILAKALEQTGAKGELSSVVMVGDRRHDVEAAKAHGVDSIGVTWGYGSVEELQNEGATHLANDSSELKQLIV